MSEKSVFTTEVLAELNGFLAELKNGSDHSCAILAGSKIDSQLEKALKARILPQRPHKSSGNADSFFDSTGALSTFSSRIEASYRLGLITSRDADALDQLRHIRNYFAHTTENLLFTTPPVCDRITEFSKTWKGTSYNKLLERYETELKGCSPKRIEFLVTCSMFITFLTPLSQVLIRLEQISFVNDLQNRQEDKFCASNQKFK